MLLIYEKILFSLKKILRQITNPKTSYMHTSNTLICDFHFDTPWMTITLRIQVTIILFIHKGLLDGENIVLEVAGT